jgi:hypothetical protein
VATDKFRKSWECEEKIEIAKKKLGIIGKHWHCSEKIGSVRKNVERERYIRLSKFAKVEWMESSILSMIGGVQTQTTVFQEP